MQNTMVCFVFVAFHQLTGTAHLKKDFLQLFMKENHKVMFLFSVTETSILRQVSYTTTTTHTVTATQTVHESGAETSDTSSVPRSHFTSQTAAARRRPLSYTDLKRRPAALQVNGTLPLRLTD